MQHLPAEPPVLRSPRSSAAPEVFLSQRQFFPCHWGRKDTCGVLAARSTLGTPLGEAQLRVRASIPPSAASGQPQRPP